MVSVCSLPRASVSRCEALDVKGTDFSPGVRRMQAMVGQEAPFDHGRGQTKVLAGL
ncbi:MAG: hypothetical protein QOJ99_2274, partial [Bryobacterales bacterium]|nr:hypothetical protein [Bryobacterales bacterium]